MTAPPTPPSANRSAIAREAYDTLAERYAARVDDKAHNAHYERPATLSLLPAVAGMRVLDAGCGPGNYAETLLAAGAQVVGVDVSAGMLAMARLRLHDQPVLLVRADLEYGLGFLAAESFDLILSALVLDHVFDWRRLFAEFRRVLRPRGQVVISVTHPFVEYIEHPRDGGYFEVARVDHEWRGFGKAVAMPSYRRSFGEMVMPILENGFMLETVLEPQPNQEFDEADPTNYAELMTRPGFICFRARLNTEAT